MGGVSHIYVCGLTHTYVYGLSQTVLEVSENRYGKDLLIGMENVEGLTLSGTEKGKASKPNTLHDTLILFSQSAYPQSDMYCQNT